MQPPAPGTPLGVRAIDVRACAVSWATGGVLLLFLNGVSSLGQSKGLCSSFPSEPGVTLGNLSPLH